jgi:hypothetical protein
MLLQPSQFTIRRATWYGRLNDGKAFERSLPTKIRPQSGAHLALVRQQGWWIGTNMRLWGLPKRRVALVRHGPPDPHRIRPLPPQTAGRASLPWLHLHCPDEIGPTLPKTNIVVLAQVGNKNILSPVSQFLHQPRNFIPWHRMDDEGALLALVREQRRQPLLQRL